MLNNFKYAANNLEFSNDCLRHHGLCYHCLIYKILNPSLFFLNKQYILIYIFYDYIYFQGILKEYNPTEIGDIRLLDITLKHLLHHSAGWDRDRAGDPVFWKVGKHMNVAEPVAPCVLIQYLMGRKLQFAPGEYNCNGVVEELP